MKTKTISTRVTQKKLKEINRVCALLNIKKSDFLKACIRAFVDSPEEFLKQIGFRQHLVWVTQKRKEDEE